MDAYTVHTDGIVSEKSGVIIRKDLPIPLEHKPAPGVGIFLQTHNVWFLLFQIAENSVESLFVFVVTTILAHVIGYDLDGALWHFLCRMEGHVDAKWRKNKYVTQNGNPQLLPFKGEPEEDEEQVGKQEEGKEHPQIREHLMRCRMNAV
jgi:hypothetical protein